MEFWRLFEQFLRELHRNVMQEIARRLDPVHHAIDWWLGDLFEKPLPEDWRKQWYRLLDRMEAEHRVRADPTSAREVADWIEGWAKHCGLLPVDSTRVAPTFAVGTSVSVVERDDSAATDTFQPKSASGNESGSKESSSGTIAKNGSEQEKQFRQLARQIANLEQRRIGLTDDERAQFEFHLVENFRLHLQGRTILPPPDFWLDKDNAYSDKIRARREMPTMHGISGEKYERSERDWKLSHPERIDPGEYRVLASLAREEARRTYYSDPNRSFLGLFLDRLLNPAWEGSGNLNDMLGVIGPLGGASYFPRQSRGVVRAQPALEPKKPKPPLPPPVSEKRVSNIRGTHAPHPSHKLGGDSQDARALWIQENLPDEFVILWGKPVTANGPDVISYNRATKRITFWDDKYRGKNVRIQPSDTFAPDSSTLNKSLDEAIRAVRQSRLSDEDKTAALKSLENGRFGTRTVGSGRAKNSTFGDHK